MSLIWKAIKKETFIQKDDYFFKKSFVKKEKEPVSLGGREEFLLVLILKYKFL